MLVPSEVEVDSLGDNNEDEPPDKDEPPDENEAPDESSQAEESEGAQAGPSSAEAPEGPPARQPRATAVRFRGHLREMIDSGDVAEKPAIAVLARPQGVEN